MNNKACVFIVVPDHLYYQITRDGLEARLHTLVAKPLTPIANEAIELIEIAKKNNLHGAVEFQNAMIDRTVFCMMNTEVEN